MLQAHSFLWHYLWIAPNVFLLALAFLIRRRGLHKQFPVFQIFAITVSIEQLALYAGDVIPSVSGETFWRLYWGGLLIEASLKFALIAEIFSLLFARYSSLANFGKRGIQGLGVLLVTVAILTAVYTPVDNPRYSIISHAHILDQSIYLIECGLLVFLFVFAAYFHLAWNRMSYGIAFGLAVSACIHLATWAVVANGGLLNQRHLIDFINMGTYHACVLIWCYYLLVPQKEATKSTVSLPDNNLAIWNRELERLLQQ
jgi:hypothetical protein